MNEFEPGPSSFSTLYFVPDFIKQLLDEKENDVFQQKDNNYNNCDNITINTTNTTTSISTSTSTSARLLLNNYTLRSKGSIPRSLNKKSLANDYETMAFVGLRDIIKINDNQLAKLYNYNKREYQTFQAAINNSNIDYLNLINVEEFCILYHLFGRISCHDSWMEMLNDLGFVHFFMANHWEELFFQVRNFEILAKNNELFELRFFMQLIIFYWLNINEMENEQHSMGQTAKNKHQNRNFVYFWIKSLAKTIGFIETLRVNQQIEIYCLFTQKWMNATIIKLNKSEKLLYAQYNGHGQCQWISYYSQQLAPKGFIYDFVPNMMKRNNVPCIVNVVDRDLDSIAIKHPSARNAGIYQGLNYGLNLRENVNSARNAGISGYDELQIQQQPMYVPPAKKSRIIPRNKQNRVGGGKKEEIPSYGWYYQLQSNNQVGPVSIAMLFLAAVERQIDENTPVHHEIYGTTTLSKLPQIVYVFRKHVQKCKIYIDHEQSRPGSTVFSDQQSRITPHPQLSIFTSSSNSSFHQHRYRDNRIFGDDHNFDGNHKNTNVFIPDSNVNRF